MGSGASKGQSSPPRSRLLSLPPEIRLIIYQHIFDSMPSPHDVILATSLEPASLFQICRIIRYEANYDYYSWLSKRMDEIRDEQMQPVPHCAPDDVNQPLQEAFAEIRRFQVEFAKALDWAREYYRRKGLIGLLRWRSYKRMAGL